MDLIRRLQHFEGGGTVENPKALLREAIAEIERLRGLLEDVVGIAVDRGERLEKRDAVAFAATCCGKCPGATCYVDQMTGA